MTTKTKKLTPQEKAAKGAAEAFARDVAEHAMTVLHDDGLYRHLRFTARTHGFSWFELITWPGALAIRGDHGAHVFARTDDMFTFFRRPDGGINPGYWAKETPDHGRSLRVYSEDMLGTELKPYLAEHKRAYPDLKANYAKAKAEYDALPREKQWGKRKPIYPKTPAEIRDLIKDYADDGELTFEDGARRLLSELESAGVVECPWEWDLTDWDYHYLWCCHAIVWGIAQYDAGVTR